MVNTSHPGIDDRPLKMDVLQVFPNKRSMITNPNITTLHFIIVQFYFRHALPLNKKRILLMLENYKIKITIMNLEKHECSSIRFLYVMVHRTDLITTFHLMYRSCVEIVQMYIIFTGNSSLYFYT